MYKISKHIPIPHTKRQYNKNDRLAFMKQLEVGDSFIIKERGMNTNKAWGRFGTAIKKLGFRITCRLVKRRMGDAPTHVRVWRTK
jgi:hypothetical protein